MSETTQKPEINDESYETYMANEPLRPEEVSDPGHLLYDEDRQLLDRMVAVQKAGLGHIITDEFTDENGETHPDMTPSAMVTGAIFGESMNEPGYEDEETSEISEYVDKLVDTQYEDRVATLKTFGLYNPEQPKEGDVPAPTLEQAKEILANQVTPKQFEVITNMKEPALQLVPITSMNRYVKALDSYKPMEDQNDAYISSWHKDAFKRADERDGVIGDTITGWKIAVTERAEAPKLLESDDVNRTLRERDTWFKQECERKGVSGVDFKRILVLMMDSLKNGEPINNYYRDNGTWTFVNEEGEKNGFVSGILWNAAYRQVDLFGYSAGYRNSNARFRASVMVDAPSLSPKQKERLLSKLQARFEANMKRHRGIEWSKVEARLNKASPEKLRSLNRMEETGGKPDVIKYIEKTGEFEFWDCSKESPKERRSLCYDREGQKEAERQGYSPAGNAVDMATAMGLGGILNEEQYRKLQELDKFDETTWSWIQTSSDTRKRGVALNGRRVNGVVFLREFSPDFHSDYGVFRGWLRV